MPKKHHKHQLTLYIVQRIDVNVRPVCRQLHFSSVRCFCQFIFIAVSSSGSANDIEDSRSPELSRFPRILRRIWRARMAPTLHQIVMLAHIRRRLQALLLHWTPRLPTEYH